MEEKIGRLKILFGCFAALTAVIFFNGCKSAVLTATVNSILYVTVNPSSIPVGGTSTVKVVGYKASGTLLPDGTVISFSCDIGSIDPRAGTENGVAYATFRSDDNRSGVANISVRSGNAEVSPESITITIGSSALHTLSLSADPQVLPVGGGTSKIKITAYDENLNTLANIPVTLTTDAGQLGSGGNVIQTNANGEAEDTLQTTGTAVVTAASGDISAGITVTVESNENPTASFVYSPANPLVDQKVYFNASESSDPDGHIVSYEWDFGDGRTAAGQTTDHKYKQAGTFTVLLTVRDNNGNRDSADKNITVTLSDAPTASFVYSPTDPGVGEDVYFNAADSKDSDGYIVSYDWDFGDGSTDAGVSITHQYANAGTYTVLLVVTDNNGNTGSTGKTLTVTDNQNPTASFVYSPTNPAVDENVYFNASNSTDPDGHIVGYDWDFGDGSTDAGVSVTHQYTGIGTYTVSLVVTDDKGNTDSTGKTITVTGNQNPTASFVYSPSNPKAGENIYFNASDSSDVDGTIVDFQWDMGDGKTRSGEKITYSYSNAGTYTVLLVVTDNSGNTGSTSKTVTVSNNQNPTASFTYSPSGPKVGDNVYFNAAASSDPDGTITTYQWDFGDGNTGSGENVNHSYGTAGTYTVVLVVYDDSGGQGSTSQNVTVSN